MPLLNKIKQMKDSGLGESEISQQLLEEGFSPHEVDEAIDQSKIKLAVDSEEAPSSEMFQSQEQFDQYPNENRRFSQEINTEPIPEQDLNPQYTSQPAQYPETMQQNAPEQYAQEPSGEEAAYPEYPYSPEIPIDTGVITEITEQIIDEKTEKINEQLTELIRFKIESQERIKSLNERTKRIETIIDNLQASILKEVGSQLRNISDLKKEMISTQESFSKVLSPLAEHIKELKKISGEIDTGSSSSSRIKKS